MTTKGELFIIEDVRNRIADQLEDIANRMLAGSPSWDQYLKDVGAAKALRMLDAEVEGIQIDATKREG